MVIAQSKSFDSSLKLECEEEPLSEAQSDHHKKKLENIFLLHSALQSAIFKDSNFQPISNENSSAPPESGSYDVSKMAVGFDTSIMNGGSESSAGQLLHLMLTRNNGTSTPPTDSIKNEIRSSGRKPRIQVKSVTDIAEVQPTLTQKLRAARKTGGTLTIQNDEPEIEVVGEKRSKPMVSIASPSGTGTAFKPILPRQNNQGGRSPITHSTIKLKPTSFNTILLTINIKPKNSASVTVNAAQRKDLDGKVKTILIKSSSEFVEYLLNQGLIRSQQYCSIHKNVNMQANKLKLGIFNDALKLANSGGYVWLGECCGRKYVSVYCGSVFGNAVVDKVPPAAIAKLIYHWSCQTAIANVETWVKVERNFIGKVFHHFRAVCSVILHDKVFDFGSGEEKVELGIVSLGTTTPNGNKKSVKVEILGLFDRKSGSYRLFASAPESVTNARERFVRILKPIAGVVAKNAVIICDQSVDPTCLHQLGYNKIDICSARDDEMNPASNGTIMTYLRRHVPKMFQVSLSSLNEAQVQMCLDELCWREKYGYTSLNCFENMMEHLSYLTMMEMDNPGLIPLLDYVSENPHKNWRFKDNAYAPKPDPKIKAVILAPPVDETPNVLNVQSLDPKKLHPITHGNKVMSESAASSLSLSISGRVSRPSNTNVSVTPKGGGNLQQLFSLTKSLAPKVQNREISIKASAVKTNVAQTSIAVDRSEFKLVEPFYYGKIPGNENMGTEPNTSEFKCHLCAETYSDNIQFYSHLKFHIEGVTVEQKELDVMCPYCTMSFDTVTNLSRHKIDVHLMSDISQIWCRICAEKMPNESALKLHLVRKHVESEMPYRCQVCNFATSFYYDIINHFNKSHRGSSYIQCHLCLTVKPITSLSANTFSMRMFTHMMKHNKKMKCFQCCLSFYCKSQASEHKKEHLSCSDAAGLERSEPSTVKVMEFKPPYRASAMSITAEQLLAKPKNPVAMSEITNKYHNLSVILMDNFPSDNVKCLECEGAMNSDDHYSCERTCTRCTYVTSCANIIGKHNEVLHPRGGAGFKLGLPVILPQPMKCKCSFQTNSGNHMARHLVLCGYTTAYPIERKPMTTIENLFIPKIEMTEGEVPNSEEMKGIEPEQMEIDYDQHDLPLIMPLDVQLEEKE